jgi:hypothetical protein
VINNALGGFNVVAGNSIGVGGGYLVFNYGAITSTGPTTYSDNGVTRLMGNALGIVTDSCAHNDLIGGTSNQYHTSQVAGNLISGNIAGGVAFLGGAGGPTDPAEIDGQIAGNTITHNAHGGVAIGSSSIGCWVGGPDPGWANDIAYNGLTGTTTNVAPGVWILDFRGAPSGISVTSNSIHDNTGLGIDIGGVYPGPPTGLAAFTSGGPDGPTANDALDADTGPNNLQNHPVLLSATASDSGTTITGTFHGTPNGTFRLQFFDNSAPAHTYPGDPYLYGEGQAFLGEADIATDASGNLATSPNGSATITYDAARQEYTFTTEVRGSGTNITATATDLVTGDTSEFSPELQLPFAFSDLGPFTAVAEGQAVTFQATIVSDPNNEPLTVSWGFSTNRLSGKKSA